MTQVSPHGLHHVTAIATDPQSNVDFYTRALGLRLVKQTVNFDAPDTYHLYYGDEKGSPSSLLTFFPWPDVPQGRQGAGMMTATAFSVPGSAIGWWHERFKKMGIDAEPPRTRDEEEVLTFRDPDGLVIDLVASVGDHRSGWDGMADIPAENAVRGLHAITLSERLLDPSATMLTDLLGMKLTAEEGDRTRFGMAGGDTGALVDVFAGVRDRGWQAGGTVHHVAFRAPDLVVDEPLLELGRSLKLPPWLEPNREQIAAALPPLQLDMDIP
jgi:glyoxalase family protein